MPNLGSLEYVAQRVKGLRRELEESPWYRSFCQSISHLDEVSISSLHCLALGSPTENQGPRFQLALLLILVDMLEIKEVTAWDPVFTARDIELLQNSFGIKVVELYEGKEQTLWYLPHAPLSLIAKIQPNCEYYVGNNLTNFQPRPTPGPEILNPIKTMRSNGTFKKIPEIPGSRWYAAFSDLAVWVRDDSLLEEE